MSIHFTVEFKDTDKEKLFGPVASHDTFWECWLPACRALELKRIPLFRTGYPAIILDQTTIPEVLEELKLLRTHFIENEDQYPSDCGASYIVKRIETLFTVMSDALANWDEIEYIRV